MKWASFGGHVFRVDACTEIPFIALSGWCCIERGGLLEANHMYERFGILLQSL